MRNWSLRMNKSILYGILIKIFFRFVSISNRRRRLWQRVWERVDIVIMQCSKLCTLSISICMWSINFFPSLSLHVGHLFATATVTVRCEMWHFLSNSPVFRRGKRRFMRGTCISSGRNSGRNKRLCSFLNLSSPN